MTRVFYTVNSGLYFENDGCGVLIDGIHGGADAGFSPSSENTIQSCRDGAGIFKGLRALLFTHCHSDHYDPAAVREILTENPVLFFAPGQALASSDSDKTDVSISSSAPGQEPSAVSGKNDDLPRWLDIGPFTVFAVKTRHDGKEPFCLEPHVSFVINTPSETFFAPGDAVFTPEDAARIRECCRHDILISFCNPYQVLLEPNREFLRLLSPEKIALIHLPYEKDDRFNARTLYRTAVKRYPADLPQLILPEFDRQIIF